MAKEAQLSVLLPDWALAALRTMATQRERSVGAEVRLAVFAHIRDWERISPDNKVEVEQDVAANG